MELVFQTRNFLQILIRSIVGMRSSGLTYLLQSACQSFQSFPIDSFVLPDALSFVTYPLVLFFKLIDLNAKFLNLTVRSLDLRIFLLRLPFKVSECGFEFIMEIVSIRLQLRDVHPEVL